MYRVLLFQIAAGLLGGYIARSKGRNQFIWGLLCFIFPLLVLVVLILPPLLSEGLTIKCPYCSGIISRGDRVCRYCKRELPIELVQCKSCGSYVPQADSCAHCHNKL